jgi:hypothetical protein
MTVPARKIHLLGTAEYRDQAETMLRSPGDAALVERGVLRSLVMRCPDGCGETLVVNLDPRAGKAWRLDRRRGTTTLYPSVWRDGGCESHFIVWRDVILWCDRFEDGNSEPGYDPGIEPLVLNALSFSRHIDAATIALQLNLIIWDAAKALRRLAARGEAREGTGPFRGAYRRMVKD